MSMYTQLTMTQDEKQYFASQNREICRLYFEEDWSSYKISENSTKLFKRFIASPNVFRIIKRDAAKFGYIHSTKSEERKEGEV